MTASRPPRIAIAALVAALVLPAVAAPEEDAEPPALRGLDPVALGEGREVPGLPGLTAQRGRYRYRFADDASRKRFLADPERHAIQFDGYCMRMGPLTGHGSADRFAVHEGRIYLFASDACRRRFLEAPPRWIDGPDGVPEGDEAARKRGGALLDLAIRGVGGADALAAAAILRVRSRTTTETAQGSHVSHVTSTHRFPGTLRMDYEWEGGGYAWLLSPEGGFADAAEGPPVEESVRAWMVREMRRQPLSLLDAWRRGGAVAVALGTATVGERGVERVAVAVDGATTTLAIDPVDGRILEASWRGRTSVGITDTSRRYSGFRTVAGLMLPHAEEVLVEGKPPSARREIVSVEVNPEMPSGFLASPR